MTRSCSAWMVSTMSLIRPVRPALSAASRAASPVSPLVAPARRGARVEVEHLVVEADDRAPAGADVPAPAHARPATAAVAR